MKKLKNLLIKIFCNNTTKNKLQIPEDLTKDLKQEVLNELQEESDRLDASINNLLKVGGKIDQRKLLTTKELKDLGVVAFPKN